MWKIRLRRVVVGVGGRLPAGVFVLLCIDSEALGDGAKGTISPSSELLSLS